MRGHSGKFWQVGWVLIGVVGVILGIERGFRPVILTAGEMWARNQMALTVEGAVDTVMETGMWDKLVEIEYDDEGRVRSVSTDTVGISQLQNSLSQSINGVLAQNEGRRYEIELGSLGNTPFTFGKGPKVACRLNTEGYADVRVSSSFTEAGINQTRHSMGLDIEIPIRLRLPGGSKSFVHKTEYLVSETLIVGMVPESYTYVCGDNRSALEKVNDYGGAGKE